MWTIIWSFWRKKRENWLEVWCWKHRSWTRKRLQGSVVGLSVTDEKASAVSSIFWQPEGGCHITLWVSAARSVNSSTQSVSKAPWHAYKGVGSRVQGCIISLLCCITALHALYPCQGCFTRVQELLHKWGPTQNKSNTSGLEINTWHPPGLLLWKGEWNSNYQPKTRRELK